ncbi:hypothetical protein F2P81_006246 [Scophthalmus maximus]|uniref:Uncharacterized protein n=1 Tax=Scophthalmus maximus TaxID=52904 RepID=A0A6A4T7N1_SCOMX|nr:hypothetical protein F2P81_006246 [Scophthalmus maximus]
MKQQLGRAAAPANTVAGTLGDNEAFSVSGWLRTQRNAPSTELKKDNHFSARKLCSPSFRTSAKCSDEFSLYWPSPAPNSRRKTSWQLATSLLRVFRLSAKRTAVNGTFDNPVGKYCVQHVTVAFAEKRCTQTLIFNLGIIFHEASPTTCRIYDTDNGKDYNYSQKPTLTWGKPFPAPRLVGGVGVLNYSNPAVIRSRFSCAEVTLAAQR